MSKTAIILGATGLTGSYLLDLLLSLPEYEKVIYYGRSEVSINNPKLEQRIINLFEIKKEADKFKADEVFCCIGTTNNKTPDYQTYKKIDKGIPLDVAELCEENDIPFLVIMSSLGAHPESAIEYSRIKGEMEQEVSVKEIDQIYFAEPSLIGGIREERRFAESAAKLLMAIIDPLLIGPLNRYKMIDPQQIAKAMVQLAREGFYKQQVESDFLLQYSAKFDAESN